MVLSALLAAALAGACLLGAEGANPLVPASMADPHIRIFNDRAYLYSGWDADKTSKGFNMPSWRIYSSDDLMEWTLETTIEPTQTWVGNSTACWATDCVYHNGAYYFFFSNHSYDIGVLRAPTPTGPFVDVLGRPLFPANATGFKQYDPTIFFDDVDSKFYIAFGLNQALQNNSFYFVAELADDMLSLAETPRRISFTGTDFSTATTPYGPFTYVGSSGDKTGKYGLQGQAHGNYFQFRNQWYHVSCYFVDPAYRWRQSWMTYLHYDSTGAMVDDEEFLDAHGANGVGSYDASWPFIRAAWYGAASNGTVKVQSAVCSTPPPCGFEVQFLDAGEFLVFPRVRGLLAAGELTLSVRVVGQGGLTVRAGNATGVVLADCRVSVTHPSSFRNVTCAYTWAGGTDPIDLLFVSAAGGLALSSWSATAAPPPTTPPLPVLSLAYHPDVAPLAAPPSTLLAGGPIIDARLQSNSTVGWLINATQFAGLAQALGWGGDVYNASSSSALYPGVQNVSTVRILGGWNSEGGNSPQDSDIVYRAPNGSLIMRWDVLDDRLAWLDAAGSSITPLIVLDNVPWALAYPDGPPAGAPLYGCNMPPADYAEYGAFIAGVARHLAARFGKETCESWLWRVGTEPNAQPGHWNSTADAFVQTYIAAAAGVHSILPSAQVGLPNFVSVGDVGARTIPYVESILRGLAEQKAPVAFVASSFYGAYSGGAHGYATYDPARAANSAQALRALVARVAPSFSGLPLYTFEHGTLDDEQKEINNEPGAFGGAWYAATAALASANGVAMQFCWEMFDWSLGGRTPRTGSPRPSDEQVSRLLLSSTLLLRAYARTAYGATLSSALVAPTASAPACGTNATLPGGWCLSPRTHAGNDSAPQLAGFAAVSGPVSGPAASVPGLGVGQLGPAPAGSLFFLISAFANDRHAAAAVAMNLSFACPAAWGAAMCTGSTPAPSLAIRLDTQSSVFDAIYAEALANGTNTVPAQLRGTLADTLTPAGLANVQANAAKWVARQASLLSPARAADVGVAVLCAGGQCTATGQMTTPTLLALWVGPGLEA